MSPKDTKEDKNIQVLILASDSYPIIIDEYKEAKDNNIPDALLTYCYHHQAANSQFWNHITYVKYTIPFTKTIFSDMCRFPFNICSFVPAPYSHISTR
jgi:hypothetical protein